MVTITLSPEEAASFVAWRAHQATFELLLDHNVFAVRNGSVELHFNSAGHIASIDGHIKMFRSPATHTIVVAKA